MSIIKSLKGYLLARLNGMLKLFHEIKYSTEFKNYNTKFAAFKKKAVDFNKGLCNALNFFYCANGMWCAKFLHSWHC